MEKKTGIIDMYKGTRAIGGREWLSGLKQIVSTCVLSVGGMSSLTLDPLKPVRCAVGLMIRYSSKTQTKTDVRTGKA